MGKVKDLKRKQRELGLKERRLARQGGSLSPAEVGRRVEAARDSGYELGFFNGFLKASNEALEHAKEFKTLSSIRKSLGAQVRRARQ